MTSIKNAHNSNTAVRHAGDKVKALGKIADIADKARQQGQTVVLAHGVFDLIHMGHVRHLEAARREGDVLIVTVTGDKFVNKGPNRPVFTEVIRAEMIAALEYVSWVGINPSASAEAVIEQIRPDIYIKGSDYQNEADDVTGKIGKGREAAERYGGKLKFSNDITFSSSNLINAHFSDFSPELRACLNEIKSNGGITDLTLSLNAMASQKVVLIGDTIIDEYQYVVPQGKSPKENMISALFQEKEIFAGGVIASANHVASFCDEVEVITVLGEQDSYEDLVRSALRENVKLHVVRRPDAPTTRKCRFIESSHLRKLFEIYHMNDTPLPEAGTESLRRTIEAHAVSADVVIVNDFGHGMISKPVTETIIAQSRFLALNSQTNSANLGYNLVTKFAKADFVCIDATEARLAAGDKFSSLEKIAQEVLPTKIDCGKFMMTNGKFGCVGFAESNGLYTIPAFTDMVVDTVGAGDAFFAISAPLAAMGVDIQKIGFIGNAVGAIKVGIVGHRQSVEKVPLIKYLDTILK